MNGPRDGVVHVVLFNIENQHHTFVDLNNVLEEGWKEARKFMEHEEQREAKAESVAL